MRLKNGIVTLALAAIAAGACVASAYGETVSQREALARAETFFNAAKGQVMSAPKLAYTGKRLTTQSLFVPFYVYNHPSGGFVIISAENKAFPILGYSLTENFDEKRMGETQKALLRSYARDIERIRYDSRTPYEAIEAWNDYPHYVNLLLTSRYDATDPTISPSDALESIERVIDSDDAAMASSTYSPSQWEELVNNELYDHRSAAIGIYEPAPTHGEGDFLPTVVHGRRGDYYRLTLDEPNSALYLLFATEFLSEGQIASLGNVSRPESEPEQEWDIPFSFYEEFMAETRAEREKERASIENAGIVSEPTAYRLGGGHFEIRMPENVDLVRVYNLSGSNVRQYRFADTSTASLDLSPEPAGMYIVLLRGKSGKTYGIKIAR